MTQRKRLMAISPALIAVFTLGMSACSELDPSAGTTDGAQYACENSVEGRFSTDVDAEVTDISSGYGSGTTSDPWHFSGTVEANSGTFRQSASFTCDVHEDGENYAINSNIT